MILSQNFLMDRYHVDSRTITTSSYSHEYISLKKKEKKNRGTEICTDIEKYMFKYENKKVKQSSTEHLKGFTKTKITSEKMFTSLSDFIIMNIRKDIEKK